MITVSKATLKAKMLSYFRRVEQTGEDLIVTDHRRRVLRVTPYQEKKTIDEIFSDVRGKMRCSEPLDAPTADQWGELH